jgi:hypothetical protein
MEHVHFFAAQRREWESHKLLSERKSKILGGLGGLLK